MVMRVALVTGGSRGIGRAVSIRLAERGYAVAVNYVRDAQAAAETVSQIERSGGVAKVFQANVGSYEECRLLVDQVLAHFGHVDALVNSAGIASRGLRVVDTDPDEPSKLFLTHAAGPHHLASLLVPQMRALPRADIVMISSAATDLPMVGGAPYMMAKAAQEALAKTLALEEKRAGIRVNIVAPGLTATDMGDRLATALGGSNAEDVGSAMPFGRVTRPFDIADTVAFLLSEKAAMITAQRIQVDGALDPAFFERA
jgi:NAD(P)-dependent dehydrogenase (short-subunit alcohol dehydrogenase family)